MNPQRAVLHLVGTALCVALLAAPALAQEEARVLAFERGDGVWTAALDGTGQRKAADGQGPDISPDGARLAFNTVQPPGRPGRRAIAVADLASGHLDMFTDLPSDNCLSPQWSPQGDRLLFTYYRNRDMLLGVVNADGTGFRPVQGEPKPYWSATWAADGRSLFAQDMVALYRLDLDGGVLNRWPIERLVPRGGMSGNVRLQASPDGRFLLMDVEMAERERKGWDGPPPAVWLLDLNAGKARRLTPKDLYAWDSRWLGPDDIMFVSQGPSEKTPSLYRMTLNGQGRDRRLLARDARGPSVSNAAGARQAPGPELPVDLSGQVNDVGKSLVE